MSAKKGKSKTSKKKASVKSKKSAATKSKRSTKKDNRNDQRIPIQLLVDYRSEGHYLFDFCKDLGAGGGIYPNKKSATTRQQG